LAVALLSGCQRRVQLMPAEADSTVRIPPDSLAVAMRNAQELWESGSGEQAAELTARVLLQDLLQHDPGEWSGRADALLDSLGIGSEVAGRPCVLVVNFFARSDPTKSSWPYLFWCGAKGPAAQSVEGRGLRLVSVVSRTAAGEGASGRAPDRGAALFLRQRGGRQEPMLMVWESQKGERWKLSQTLGPDSLGGTGSAQFETASDTTIDLVTRTYRVPPHFDECPSCPHVFRVHRFHWNPDGFVRIEDQIVPSPYSAFVEFIGALASGSERARELVTHDDLVDEAWRLEWGRAKGTWRIAPGAEEAGDQMLFYRGTQEAYRVRFQRRGSDWLIAGFEPIPRAVE